MGKTRILLVDDEQDFVEVLSARMAEDGFDTFVALSGEEALDALEENPPDVMVLDLRMPGLGGLEVLDRVRKDHPQTQVVILTGHGSEAVEREARRRGAFEFLEKPADYAGLKAVIGRAWSFAKGAARVVGDDLRMTFMESEPTTRASRQEGPSTSTRKGEKAASLKVLLVDDEEDFVKSLADRMEIKHLESEAALSGEEALEILGYDPPHVMILDLNMPGMGGMGVLRQVRKDFPEVQVIILTGHGSPAEEAEAKRLGAFEYLKKPIEFRDLVSRIHAAGQKLGIDSFSEEAK
jgi:DNA-binding NtrC family response regulator